MFVVVPRERNISTKERKAGLLSSKKKFINSSYKLENPILDTIKYFIHQNIGLLKYCLYNIENSDDSVYKNDTAKNSISSFQNVLPHDSFVFGNDLANTNNQCQCQKERSNFKII